MPLTWPELIGELRGARKAPGVERIHMPGEREYLTLAERRENGIPVPRAVLAELDQLGTGHGVQLRRMA